MAENEHSPFETPLHKFMKKSYVYPNSISCHALYKCKFSFGLSPNINWKKLWDENKFKNKKRPDFSGLFFIKLIEGK